MKKILLIAFVFSSAFVQAQVNFGVKAGANFYNLTGSDVKDQGITEYRKLKTGIVAGVIAEIKLSDLFTVQPSLLYSQEGNLQKKDEDKATVKLDYLNLPVVLKYTHASGFFGETGPQIGYLLSGKVKTKSGGMENEADLKDQLKSTAFSWTIGAGWKFKSGLGINARSQWAISSAFEDNKIGNSGFNATVFYIFNRGKK